MISAIIQHFVRSKGDLSLYNDPLVLLTARIVTTFELLDLVHCCLNLRTATPIETFRIVSHIWLIWCIALPSSQSLGIYILLESIPMLLKHLFVSAVAFRLNMARLLKPVRYQNFYLLLPLELIASFSLALEFILNATYPFVDIQS